MQGHLFTSSFNGGFYDQKNEVKSFLIAIMVFFLLFQGVGYLLLPELDISGTNWKSYKKEPQNSIQVMFVGSSVVFCDISPAAVYETSGITSYLIAGPEQTMPVSYYYIREACKTQKPEAIFVELKGLFFAQYGEHTIANFAFMPHDMNRLEAIFHAARKEDIPGLLFPVLDFHDRWNDISLNELQERAKATKASVNAGYMQRNQVSEQQAVTSFHPNGEYMEECVTYLRKISQFCNEQGIKLYLFFAPVTDTVDQKTKEWVELLVKELNITDYYDFSNEAAFQKIGLDMKTDWADVLHLNADGTAKFSSFLAKLLRAEGIQPCDREDIELWEMRIRELYMSENR